MEESTRKVLQEEIDILDSKNDSESARKLRLIRAGMSHILVKSWRIAIMAWTTPKIEFLNL
jgi:hypothetical protein